MKRLNRRILRSALLAGIPAWVSCTVSNVADLGLRRQENPDAADSADDFRGSPDAEAGEHSPDVDAEVSGLGVDAGAIGAAPRGGPPCVPTGCIEDGDLSAELPDLECFELTARAKDDASAAYPVPAERDRYLEVTLDSPWSGVRYLRSLRPIIDASPALHDMQLFAHHGVISEGVDESSAPPSPAREIFAWSPGETDLTLDPAVGIPIEADASYTLRLHYNYDLDPSPPPLTDRSGFEVCATRTAPAYSVSFSRLGTQDIAGVSAQGSCTPDNQTRVYLLAVQPEMNLYGDHVQLVIDHVSGSTDIVEDAPFAFSEATLTAVATYVDPGDTLTTTCSYSRDVQFGTRIYDELCNVYVLHWPAFSLISAAAEDPDSCLE